MRDNMNTETKKLLAQKNKYLSKAKDNLDTISNQNKDTNELNEALRISKKLDNGESVTTQESDKLKDIKNHYESYFEDEDGNVHESDTTASLNDAINSITEDKLSLVSKLQDLKKKARMIDKVIMDKEKEASLPVDSSFTETESNNKKRKTSLLSEVSNSSEMETKNQEKSSSTDDSASASASASAEKVIKEKEKKSSLIDDYADTSLEMQEFIDD